jgi:hypothetical protein
MTAFASMWGNGGRRLLLATGATITALGVLVGALVMIWLTKPADPLGDYPLQEVAEASVYVGESVTVTGTKCADEEVAVEGQTYWVSLDPGGEIVAGVGGVGTRKKGCETRTYKNRPPAEVSKTQMEWCNHGMELSQWYLSGKETPVNGGKPRSWTTESFFVVCDGE